MRKRRVLFIGEASFLATGFSTYWMEVLKRLHATGQFEIAELGSYANDGDPRIAHVPWKFYPVGPDDADRAGNAQYHSSPTNQFGEWRFSNVLLDFQPDIVCGIRDWWMDEFVLRSPYRDSFKFVWMPTVDGAPQREPWLDSYRRCDGILTYSQWGMELLRKEGHPDTPLITVASPGADLDVFKPVSDKAAHKARAGIDPKVNIVGTVMRNQQRKLYVDLCEAYADWFYRMKSGKHLDLAHKTYLYLHTSYPDVGYDIGKAVRRFKIGNRVLMTYLCANCGAAFPAFFSGEWTNCRRCGKPAAHPPNASRSVPREVLANIVNLFDVYVQYSICEGWGMPCTEAMACGVPVMAVNYSAMQDHVKMPGGIPINVGRFFYEPVIQTEQRRALPDNDHFGQQLTNFLRMKSQQREELCKLTREYIEEPADVWGQTEKLPRFGWDRTATIWANVIDSLEIHDPAETWLNPKPKTFVPNADPIRGDMTNAEFVRWAFANVLGRPDMARSYAANEWVKSLNCGMRAVGGKMAPVDRLVFVNECLEETKRRNDAELARVSRLGGAESGAEWKVV